MLNATQLSRVDLNLLLPFALLHEERHAGRVASRLNLSPSAVSHALRRLRAMFDDPLFLPTARGMTPTARADELAPAIREIIDRVGRIATDVAPFDPATSERRFRIGAVDAAAAPVLPALVEHMRRAAPAMGLSTIPLLPAAGQATMDAAWRHVVEALAGGGLDLAILPFCPASSRLRSAMLYDEEFVVVFRRAHPFARQPSLAGFLAARHALVSATGDSVGIVDLVLSEQGLTRQVALTVPSFFQALEAIARSDLIGAVPRGFAEEHAERFGLAFEPLPFAMAASPIHAVALQAALPDRGICWLLDQVMSASNGANLR